MSGACEYNSYYKKPHKATEEEREEENKQLEIIRLAIMAAILVFVTLLHLLQPTWLANIVTVTAVIVGGYPLYRESFSALRRGRVNMELSMVIAIIASLILSQFLPAIAIAFFALLSEFIEGLIVQKGRKNIQLIYNRTPKKAVVRIKNKEVVNESFLKEHQEYLLVKSK
jgi:cation transport ATPase